MKWSIRAVVMIFVAFSLGTVVSPSKASIATEITIERFVYDGQVSQDYDEYVKLCNVGVTSVNLGGTNPWRMGDDEAASGGGEGMYELQGTLDSGACFIIASNADAFSSVWSFLPDYEMRPGVGSWGDNASVPNLVVVDNGVWALANSGDNITLWKYNAGTSTYDQHDEVAYGSTAANYTDVGLPGDVSSQIDCGSNTNCALTRNDVATDTDDMASDFNNSENPTALALTTLTGRSSGRASRVILPISATALLIAAVSEYLRRRW
jgi:hypothetical protein